jgi:hypothetical protein
VIRIWLIAILALGLVSPIAEAQPRGRGGDRAGVTPVERRERIKKRIRALRAYTLTDELDLDEAGAGKLFPILAKYDDEIGKVLVERAKLRQSLAAAIAKRNPKATDRAIDDLVANQKAIWAIDEKRFAELRKVLTPTQAGRLLVVLPALERKVQNMLSRAVAGGRAGGRAGRGRARDDEDDDELGGNPYPLDE